MRNLRALGMNTRAWLLAGLLAWAGSGSVLAASLNFSFTLDKTYTTSAGAYRTDGTLVKTLWRKVSYGAGSHSATWNGTDDSGGQVASGTYQIRVLYHNVNYVWQGVIGNTSDNETGTSVHRALLPMNGMAIDGTNGFYTVGYNEGQPGLHSFSTNTPQQQLDIAHGDYKSAFNYVATDGQRVYYANSGTGYDASSWVVAFQVSDKSEYAFPNGVVQGTGIYDPNYWNNVIDKDGSSPTTGLAVQKSGTILAVAHGSANQVRLLDKNGGNLLRTISVTNPQGLAMAPNGDLWVICDVSGKTVVQRYTNLGSNPTVAATVNTVAIPLAVAVSPQTNDLVLIADGATHQVKAFNSAGASLWTYSKLGGYAQGPTVSPDKLWFKPVNTPLTFLSVLADGSFWVYDSGNYRALHLSASRQYIENIMFLKANRVATVDVNNPSRVFSECLEFKVDYSKSLGGTNGSWNLVNNWCYGTPYQNLVDSGFSQVATLSNGRTYGMYDRLEGGGTTDLVELNPNPPAVAQAPLRIRVGGDSYVDSQNQSWSPEYAYTSGNLLPTDNQIANTADQPLFRAERYGPNFFYKIPVESGTYTLTLNFAELNFNGTGQRKFNVNVEDQPILTNFDVVAAAGSANTAVSRTFPVTITDGLFNLNFAGVVNDATIGSFSLLRVGAIPKKTVKVGLRQTGMVLSVDKTMETDGSLQYLTEGGTQTFYRQALSGFDVYGNPSWGSLTTLGQVSTSNPNDPWWHYANPFPSRVKVTSSNIVITFDCSSRGNNGMHLGGVKLGDNKWLWKASPAAQTDYAGTYQTYEIDGTIQYAGNLSMVSGRNVVYGYNGEFWTDLTVNLLGQANQFMHFWDDGLFVGEFGRSWYVNKPESLGTGALSGAAGNAFSPTLISNNGQLYLYHNDESSHSGVQRWLLDGVQDIKELTGNGTLGGSVTLN